MLLKINHFGSSKCNVSFSTLDTLLRLKFKAFLCETLIFRTIVQISDQTRILKISERENEDALAK